MIARQLGSALRLPVRAWLRSAIFHTAIIKYQVLRLAVPGYAAWIAFVSYNQKGVTWAWAFGLLALLYNPFFKISLDRDTWGFVNIATAGIIQFEFWKFPKPMVQDEASDPV
jgi:hypothetical protein